VREHLLAVGRHWIERGIDGWRLDVPDEVEPSFRVAFSRVVREANPEAWIVGEIWGDARAWLGGEHFDGVMNYRVALVFLPLVNSSLAPSSSSRFQGLNWMG
jgi:neopullulanase